MRSWITGKVRACLAAVALVALAASSSPSANAATVNGVSVVKGKGWVRVSISAPGASYSVKELPVNGSGYRSIVIDVPGSSIRAGLEPKSRVPINEGLVAQVRVTQHGSGVRVYVDVLSFPKYRVSQGGGEFNLAMDSYKMRDGDPIKAHHR